MRYLEAPQREDFDNGLFLAGGITGCPDWQTEMVQLLEHCDCTILNPRRQNFPMHDPSAAPEQIEWEYDHLRKADAILFWFPYETLCPIVLYELGAWSMADKRLYVGVHPKYQRKQDVEIQTALARPEIRVVYRLRQLALQVLSEDCEA